MIRIMLCTYNGAEYIKEQIDSIISNTYPDWELYVFDDVSTDDTVSILNEYVERYRDRIHIVNNEINKGPQFNFLCAIQYMSAILEREDQIMLCDQDDIWFEDKISKTYSKMNEMMSEYGNSIPLLVSGDVKVIDKNKKIISESYQRSNRYKHDHMDLAHHLMENHIQGSTIMINKSLADMLYRIHGDSYTAETIGFGQRVVSKILHLADIRECVFKFSDEVKEFLSIYIEKLSDKDVMLLGEFASLKDMSFLQKRETIIRYHMWKSGLLRNIGLIMVI